MSNCYKPGGGNKPQPYIPAGNGDQSGEYTNKQGFANNKTKDCQIRNIIGKFNFRGSKLVRHVVHYSIAIKGESVPKTSRPFSVIKKVINGYVVSERYYDESGDAYLDIDYTCHGNPYTHPEVPHIHRWGRDSTGELKRNKKWESFK